VLYAKRLDRGRFIWPQAKDGVVSLTPAQFSMLVEGIDWRHTAWTARPEVVVRPIGAVVRLHRIRYDRAVDGALTPEQEIAALRGLDRPPGCDDRHAGSGACGA
jgi:hypothetical protein